MSHQERLWRKIGFVSVACIAGTVWFLIFFPILEFINAGIDPSAFYKTILLAFFLTALINDNLIGYAGLGAIWALYGLITGLLATETGGRMPDIRWAKLAKELFSCFVLGFVAAVVALKYAPFSAL